MPVPISRGFKFFEMIQLRDYQEESIFEMINTHHERMVVCLPTGAGKTVVFAAYTAAMIAQGKTVAIAVNRTELLSQTVNALKNMGVWAATITAKSNNFPKANAYVMMVETIARRKTQLEALRISSDVLIIDECHIGNFNKILGGFKKIIGFSATPMTVKKSNSLADFYHNLYVPVQVNDLIKNNYLVDAETYGPKNAVSKDNFKIKKSTGDYDEKQMGDFLSQKKYLNICVDYTRKFSDGKRAIIYNANIEHSIAVTNAMKEAGMNAYHVDGTTPEYQRKQILASLFTEPDAIVNNVGILTFGFDCPEVETIVLNRATTSLPLYLQMCGRGSRISSNITKDRFTIVDLCGNYALHGLWQDERDWEVMFQQKKKTVDGAAPMKSCPTCEAVLHARVMECPKCGYIFEKEKEFSFEDPQLILIKKLQENVVKIMEQVNQRGNNVYRGLHLIKERIFKENQGKDLEYMTKMFLDILPMWCKENGKKNNQWHKDYCINEMKKYYNSNTNDNAGYPF